MTTQKEAQPAPKGRVKRIRVGAQDIVSVHGKDEDNFHYRIVNDRDGTGERLQMFLNAGYEFVDTDVDTRTGRIDQPTDQGSKKTFAVGKGTTAYLMRIPKEFHKEDQAAKQKEVSDSEQTLFTGPDADYGKITSERGTASAAKKY